VVDVSDHRGLEQMKIRWAFVGVVAALAALFLATGLVAAARHRASAKVTIHLSATPAPAAVGANLTYTATVRNWGPARARYVVVRDRLPQGVTFVSAAASRGSCSGTRIVSCVLGALPRGGVARVTIVVQPTQDGRIVNQAMVRTIQPDQARWNNAATLATMVGSTADLGVSAKATPRPATIGQPLSYTFTVRNLSSVDATNVALTDRIPARSQLVSASSSQGSCSATAPLVCSLGAIAAGGTAQVTIVVQPTGLGYVTDRVSVKSDQPDTHLLNNSRTVTVRVRAA
jgi:uncharacterized repeat protein (TIGR01451 family)